MDHIDGAALANGHVHGIDDELGLHGIAHGPAYDPAGEGIQDDRKVQEACPCRDIGDVGNPEPVRLVSVEVSIHEVGSRAHPIVANRCSRAFAAADAL